MTQIDTMRVVVNGKPRIINKREFDPAIHEREGARPVAAEPIAEPDPAVSGEANDQPDMSEMPDESDEPEAVSDERRVPRRSRRRNA